MAATIYSKRQIRLVAATDGTSYKTKCFERDDKASHEVARTDWEASHGTTITLNNTAHTVDLPATGLSVIRAIYIEADGNVLVQLLDDSPATTVLNFTLAGASGTGAGAAYIDIAGFTIAASDTFVITEPDTADVTVTYRLFGIDDV